MTPSFPSLQVIHSIVTSSCLRSDHDVLRDSTAMYTRKVHGRLENIPFPISASFWIVNPQNTFTNKLFLDPPTLDSGGPSATTSYHDVSRNKGLYLFKGNDDTVRK